MWLLSSLHFSCSVVSDGKLVFTSYFILRFYVEWVLFIYGSTGTGLPDKNEKKQFSGVISLAAIGGCGGGGGFSDPCICVGFRVFGPGV